MDDDGGFGSGVRLILTALVSAILTATVVIAVGQTMIDPAPRSTAHDPDLLIPASG